MNDYTYAVFYIKVFNWLIDRFYFKKTKKGTTIIWNEFQVFYIFSACLVKWYENWNDVMRFVLRSY